MEELYDFLITMNPKSEFERVAWRIRAAKHLLLSKQDPFRDHTANLYTIKELSLKFKIHFDQPEFLSGVEFLQSLNGLSNEEITERTNSRTNSTTNQ